jgi:hypothetical protein
MYLNSLSGARAMFVRSIACLACLCGFAMGASAEDSPEVIAARQARLKAMQQIAERFKVQAGDEEQRKTVPLIKAPLLRFNDPAREFHDATLWAWGEKGRPLCLLTIEQYGDRSWFELIALSSQRLTAEAEVLRWTPRASAIELQPFPDASPSSDKAPQRLVQMKELLGRLAAYEVGRTGSRYELRLMPRPLYRYNDDKAEVVDGAIFAFAYGTNPELLAVIEARGAAASIRWQIGFARCGTAEQHVLLKAKEIFELPYAKTTDAKDSYWNFSYTFKKTE